MSGASGSALPLLRDERPEFQVRELERIVRERAGLADDATSEAGAAPGLTSPRANPRPGRSAFVRPGRP